MLPPVPPFISAVKHRLTLACASLAASWAFFCAFSVEVDAKRRLSAAVWRHAASRKEFMARRSRRSERSIKASSMARTMSAARVA